MANFSISSAFFRQHHAANGKLVWRQNWRKPHLQQKPIKISRTNRGLPKTKIDYVAL
jgi:hypothetical protein